MSGAVPLRQRTSLSRVQCPLLPAADKVMPYLEQVDTKRWYSNRGELVYKLEKRLSETFGQDRPSLISVASGTAALEAAILAAAGRATPERPLALIPSYTFVATALAAIRIGYRPHFVDIDRDTWAMDPAACLAHPLLDKVGLILPVAPFGRAPDMRAWEAVQDKSGIAVVVDAAASFEQYVAYPHLVSRHVPAVLSFHATKSFSTVEGGAVLWRDEQALLKLGAASYFGLTDSRLALCEGFNGKLSEYHAAVGHATLDEWPERDARYRAIAAAYGEAWRGGAGRILTTPTLSAAYVLHEAPSVAESTVLEQRLLAAGVGTRRWYGAGLHAQPFFTQFTHDPMPVTDDLAARHLGLPAAIDLSASEVATVVDLLTSERGGRAGLAATQIS